LLLGLIFVVSLSGLRRRIVGPLRWTIGTYPVPFPAVVDTRRYDMTLHTFYPLMGSKMCRLLGTVWKEYFSHSIKVRQLVLRVSANLLRVRRWGECMTVDVSVVDPFAIALATWVNDRVTVPRCPHIWHLRIARRYCRFGEVLRAENLRSVNGRLCLFMSGMLGVMTLPHCPRVSWMHFQPTYISKRQS